VTRGEDEKQYAALEALRRQLGHLEMNQEPSDRHDATVLAAARRMTAAAERPRPRWFVPASMAASFVLGGVLAAALVAPRPAVRPTVELYVPSSALTRGAAPLSADQIPVEQADPAAWYRYIEELLASGQREDAARHLQRFNELHPDYVHQP
jgi:hypothetical protein